MSKWFDRGREARMHGRDRISPDGRLSSKSRQDFYAGWDEEDRQRQPAPTPEQLQESREALDGIRDYLAKNR